MKGGYKLIDFKNISISIGNKVTIRSIYESIESSYRKPLIITNLVIDNNEKNDVYISILKNDVINDINCYVISFVDSGNIIDIRIYDNDEVEIVMQ